MSKWGKAKAVIGGNPKTGNSGRPGDCDPNQLAALKAFVLRIAEMPEILDCTEDGDPGVCGMDMGGLPPDNVCLRYLRARKFDVNLAVEMFSNCLQWRADSSMLDDGLKVSANNALQDFNIPQDKLDKAGELWQFGYHHTDRNGRPLYIDRIGKCDVHKMLEVISIEEFLDWHIFQWEECLNEYFPACSIANQTCIEQNCSIVDLDGLQTSYLWDAKFKEVFRRMSKMDSDNYPETMGKFFIINAGFVFRNAWKMLKGFLDPKTASKITVLGGSYKEELEKFIDPKHLPDFLGGSCKCPGGCLSAKPGPWQGNSSLSAKRQGKHDSRSRLGDAAILASKACDGAYVTKKQLLGIQASKPGAGGEEDEFHETSWFGDHRDHEEPENIDEILVELEREEAARAQEPVEEEVTVELGSPTQAKPPPPQSCWSCCGSKDKSDQHDLGGVPAKEDMKKEKLGPG